MSAVDKQSPDAATSPPTAQLQEVALDVTDGVATLRLGARDATMVTLTEARIEQLEAAVDALKGTEDLREQLGLNDYVSAANTFRHM